MTEIIIPNAMYKIYISSTYSDLHELRKDAIRIILDLKHHPVAMENYNSTSEKPLAKCLKDIQDCDIFVGIYAFRYGFIPDGYEKSITHLEYEEACKWDKTRLLFIVDEDAPIPPKWVDVDRAPINEFRKTLLKDHVIPPIKNLNDFGGRLATSIHEARPGPENKPARIIPPILPYLSDRSPQEVELEIVLDECEECLHEKPLVCLIHGDEMECHDKFIRRLHEVMLPRLLVGTASVSVDLIPVEWPSMQKNLEIRYRKLTNDIAYRLTNNRHSKIIDIRNELNRKIAAQMVYFMLPVAAWEMDESELINRWLQFWNEFPDLNMGKKLMVFLCVKYKNMTNCAGGEAKNYSQRNNEARTCIETLNINAYPNITPLIMTELKAIEYSDVDKWIENHTPHYCDDTKIRELIMAFFSNRNNKAVPMLELAVKLNELLYLSQIREGIQI